MVPVSLLAKRIVEAIDGGRTGEIAEPAYASWVWVLKGLPAGMGELVREVVGVDGAAWGGVGWGRTG